MPDRPLLTHRGLDVLEHLDRLRKQCSGGLRITLQECHLAEIAACPCGDVVDARGRADAIRLLEHLHGLGQRASVEGDLTCGQQRVGDEAGDLRSPCDGEGLTGGGGGLVVETLVREDEGQVREHPTDQDGVGGAPGPQEGLPEELRRSPHVAILVVEYGHGRQGARSGTPVVGEVGKAQRIAEEGGCGCAVSLVGRQRARTDEGLDSPILVSL